MVGMLFCFIFYCMLSCFSVISIFSISLETRGGLDFGSCHVLKQELDLLVHLFSV